MRAFLEGVGIAALGLLCLVTAVALCGSYPLPDGIPTHFDLRGHVDGWGSPALILFMPLLALVLYASITVVARYPLLAKHPVEATAEDRPRLQHLALRMVAWLKVEMVGIFACLQITWIRAAHHPDDAASLLGVWILVGTMIVTVIGFVAAMVHTRHRGDPAFDSEPVAVSSQAE